MYDIQQLTTDTSKKVVKMCAFTEQSYYRIAHGHSIPKFKTNFDLFYP